MVFETMVSGTVFNLFSNYSSLEYKNAINYFCTFAFVIYNLAKFIQF